MQETRKPQKEEKRSLEKKDTENMEMKKPEEQAKPKKKKIISVVRPQNATSKEAKEFTKNQGQKKTVRPAETAVRKETAMETEEARTVRTVETETAEMEIVRTAMETVRRESAVSTITETARTAAETVRRENAASAETMETARTAAETVREETAITAEEAETVREAEDHSVSVPHVQTEADREIMAEDRSQERMMIPRIRTAVREETAAEPSIRALQAIQ